MNGAFNSKVLEKDPTKWVAKSFGIFVEVCVAVASFVGLGPLAQTFSNAASGLLASAASLTGVQLPAGATTLLSFVVKASINACIIEGIKMSPLGGVLPGLAKDDLIATAGNYAKGYVKKKADAAVGGIIAKGFAS
jgi:hypothetical protein